MPKNSNSRQACGDFSGNGREAVRSDRRPDDRHVENEKTALATLSRDEQEQLDRLLGKWLAGR